MIWQMYKIWNKNLENFIWEVINIKYSINVLLLIYSNQYSGVLEVKINDDTMQNWFVDNGMGKIKECNA